MKDEIILKLLNSSLQDVVLGMNYLAEKSLLEIMEFFEGYSENRERYYDYLLYPKLLTITHREDTSYILTSEYDLIHNIDSLQLCKPGFLSKHYPKFIKL